jgi:acyl-CoA thioesterase
MSSFSQLLASAQRDADELTLTVPADWMQGRSVFGGLQAAFALRAMRLLVPDVPLRTLQTTFIAPVAASMRVRARILRQGKNAIHVEARIGDAAATQAIVIGVFGAARSSSVARVVERPELELDESRVIERPFGAKTADAPHFSAHFNVRWLRGQPPFSGDSSLKQVLEIGLDDEALASEAHVLAIADYIAPIALSHLKSFAPGSSLTWMLELLVDQIEALPVRGFRVDGELLAARDGYTNQTVTIFAPNGVALALSHQTMLVFG